MTRMSLRHNTHDATRNALRTRYVLGDMLGQSPQMEQVRQTIFAVCPLQCGGVD